MSRINSSNKSGSGSSGSSSGSRTGSSSGSYSGTHHYEDPLDYDTPEEYADDAWESFGDWDEAYDYWEDY